MKYKFGRGRADETSSVGQSSAIEIIEVSKESSKHKKRDGSGHKRNSSSHRRKEQGTKSSKEESRQDPSSSEHRRDAIGSQQKNSSSRRRSSDEPQRSATTSPSKRLSSHHEGRDDIPTRHSSSPKKTRRASPTKRAASSKSREEPLLQGEAPASGRSNHSKSTYLPPRLTGSEESDIASRIDGHNEDKYSTRAERTVAAQEPKYSRPHNTFMNIRAGTACGAIPPSNRLAALRNPVPEASDSHSFDQTEGETRDSSKAERYSGGSGSGGGSSNRPRQSKQIQRDLLSMETDDSDRFLARDALWSDDEYLVMKQRIAYLCIAVSSIQLAILLIQLILCGVASVSVNPMIGPFPDAFSEWGGKNAYLMLEERQYFRFVTPAFLNVGLVHLLVNVFCQLETCAFFEREWGSIRWLVLYLISTVGCVATSSVWNPDDIAVCSSGALMGLFGAKIAQVITWTAFDLRSHHKFDSAQLDQLGGVMCSAALVSLLSCVTYIEWSGHMGGFVAGFCAGMFTFCRPIAQFFPRLLWGGGGLAGLFGGALYLYFEMRNLYPDEELGDACQYFRNLYPEGYNCECVWN